MNNSTYGEYGSLPIFSTEAVEASHYAAPAAYKATRRTYGNLELILPEKGERNLAYRVYHSHDRVSINYAERMDMVGYVYHEFSRHHCREGLWKRAVQNLYKRINFLQLNIELLQEDITEDEFEETLTTREGEYVILFKDVCDSLEAEAIHDIVRALGSSLDVHEVAELFGVKPEQLHKLRTEAHQSIRLSGGR